MNEYRKKLLSGLHIKDTEYDLEDINWGTISRYAILSEEFIREFQNEVDWIWISRLQLLSDEFLLEFKDKIDWHQYFYNDNVSYLMTKKFLIRTGHKDLSYSSFSRLSKTQKQEIQKILDVKYMFK